MPSNPLPTHDVLTSEEIAFELLLMKELFVASFFSDGIYPKWIKDQNKEALSPRYKLTKEELDFLRDFSRKVFAVVCPDGFPDQDQIDNLQKEITKLEDNELNKWDNNKKALEAELENLDENALKTKLKALAQKALEAELNLDKEAFRSLLQGLNSEALKAGLKVLSMQEFKNELKNLDKEEFETKLKDLDKKVFEAKLAKLKDLNEEALIAELKDLIREANTRFYEARQKKFRELNVEIKNERWKLNFYNEYKETFLGATKSVGVNQEAKSEIRVLGLADGDKTGLIKFLHKSKNKYLSDDENPHKKLKKLFSENFHYLYPIAIKFNNYRTDNIVGSDVKKKATKAEISKNPRRHPLFPTVAEARADHNKEVFSDHLPILLKAPGLNIISLNVLGPGVSGSGFHAQAGWETDLEAKFRYSQMIDGLLKGIEKHHVDVIGLQETTPSFILPILKAKLGLKWEIITDERSGIITCYNKERFECVNTSLDQVERIRSIHLRDKNTKEEMEVHNVWGNFNPFPYEAEEVYKKLLVGKKHLSVVFGDTNSRFAYLDDESCINPMEDQKCNITTGAVPIGLNAQYGVEEEVQVSDYPDGGLYCKGNDEIIQVKKHILDYRSAEIVIDHRPLEELQAWPEFRMVICLDNRYKKMKVINDSSIFDYQKELINLVGDKRLGVRIGVDSINQKCVAIQFSPDSKLYEFLKKKLSGENSIKLCKIDNTSFNDGHSYPVIFAPVKKSELLHEAIVTYSATVKLLNTLKIRQEEKETYLNDIYQYANRIKELANQQVTLLNQISELPLKGRMEEEYTQYPFWYAAQIKEKYALVKATNDTYIKPFMKTVLNRIHRLKDFVDACPDTYHHTLFKRKKISEKMIANNHLTKFINESSNQARDLINKEFHSLDNEDLNMPPYFILEKAAQLIIDIAEKNISQLHKREHASLNKNSYISLLKLYIAELRKDLKDFHESNHPNKSADFLAIGKRLLPDVQEDGKKSSTFKF